MNRGTVRGLAKLADIPIPRDGWVSFGTTRLFVTSVSTASSATTVGCYILRTGRDLSGTVSKGWRVRLKDNGTTKRFIIVDITSSTITLIGETNQADLAVSSSISEVFWSPEYAPLGFDTTAVKWMVEFTSDSGQFQATPVSGTVYNPGSQSIVIPIGPWRVETQWSARALSDTSIASPKNCVVFTRLSTANNSSADTTGQSINLYTSGTLLSSFPNAASVAAEVRLPLSRSVNVTMTTPTTLYVVCSTNNSNHASIGFDGASTRTQVRATSVYV